MRRDEVTLCKCHKPVTRYQSKSQGSYGHWYYKCYKGFAPGCCKFFEWEEQPSSPSSPQMSSTQPFSSQNPPRTPSRPSGYIQAPITPRTPRTPRQEQILQGLSMPSDDDDTDEYTTAPSPTKRTNYEPTPSRLTFSAGNPVFNAASSSSTRIVGGQSSLYRAATDGDLTNSSVSELQKTVSMQERLLEAKDSQIEAKDRQIEASDMRIRALQAELVALKQEYKIRGKSSPAMATPSSTKTVIIKTPEHHAPDLDDEQAESPQPIHSHFAPITVSNDRQTLTMWN